MAEILGPLGDWRRVVAGEPPVIIHMIPVNEYCERHTFFTVGLSDNRLPRKYDEFACAELRIFLPSDWPIDETSLADSQWNWPVTQLGTLVETLRSGDEWPEERTLMNGDPPVAFDETTKQCGWVLLDSGESLEVPDFRTIDFYDLFPIYAEEQTFVREHGLKKLMQRFEEQGFPQHIDPDRPNAVGDPAV